MRAPPPPSVRVRVGVRDRVRVRVRVRVRGQGSTPYRHLRRSGVRNPLELQRRAYNEQERLGPG